MPDQPPIPPTEPAERPGNNAFLTGLKEHRLYRVALGYAVGAWVVLQVAAIVCCRASARRRGCCAR